MRSCPVEVGDIAIEHALELLILKDQQVIEAFLPQAPHEALADRIGSGCMKRCFQYLDVSIAAKKSPKVPLPQRDLVYDRYRFSCALPGTSILESSTTLKGEK